MKKLKRIGFLLSIMMSTVILMISSGFHNEISTAQFQLSQRGNATESMSPMELDIDRPGLDYRNFNLEAADQTLCRNACADDVNCKAWTYVKPNTIQGPNPRCWLKYTIPSQQVNSCCVSGTKARLRLFKGALEVATDTLSMSIPVGNGKTQEVKVRVSEKGQLIDPSTGEVAKSIDPSSIRGSEGSKIANEIWQSIKGKIQSLSRSSDRERLNFAIDAIDKYGKISDYVIPVIESRLKSLPSINPTSIIASSIASGFVTGDFPSYLDDLDGLGIRPLFDKINRALADINN